MKAERRLVLRHLIRGKGGRTTIRSAAYLINFAGAAAKNERRLGQVQERARVM